MKKLLYLIPVVIIGFVLISFTANKSGEIPDLRNAPSAEKINWVSWEEGIEMNKKEQKKIFIDLYTDWCGWCKKMDKSTFVDPEVVKYMNENFIAIKFNAEQKEVITFNEKEFKFINAGRRGVHELAYSLLDGRLGYPAFVMLDEANARILLSPGYKTPAQMMKELTFAAEEKYKTMSFTEFEKAE